MIVYCAKYIIESKTIQAYNGAMVAMLISGPVALVSLFFFKAFAPVGLIAFAFSFASYMMERYGDKDFARYLVPVALTVATVIFAIFYPSVAFVTGAMLLGYGVDLFTRIKGKSQKGLPMLIYYLAMAAGLFIAFYPVLSGVEVSNAYIEDLKWLPSWVF